MNDKSVTMPIDGKESEVGGQRLEGEKMTENEGLMTEENNSDELGHGDGSQVPTDKSEGQENRHHVPDLRYIQIKYNHQLINLDLEKARELAQKGLNYDKVYRQLMEFKGQSSEGAGQESEGGERKTLENPPVIATQCHPPLARGADCFAPFAMTEEGDTGRQMADDQRSPLPAIAEEGDTGCQMADDQRSPLPAMTDEGDTVCQMADDQRSPLPAMTEEGDTGCQMAYDHRSPLPAMTDEGNAGCQMADDQRSSLPETVGEGETPDNALKEAVDELFRTYPNVRSEDITPDVLERFYGGVKLVTAFELSSARNEAESLRVKVKELTDIVQRLETNKANLESSVGSVTGGGQSVPDEIYSKEEFDVLTKEQVKQNLPKALKSMSYWSAKK